MANSFGALSSVESLLSEGLSGKVSAKEIKEWVISCLSVIS